MPRTKLSRYKAENDRREAARASFLSCLRHRMLDFNHHQPDLAKGLNCSRSTIVKRMKDPDTFTVSQLRTICSVYQIPADSVIPLLGYDTSILKDAAPH